MLTRSQLAAIRAVLETRLGWRHTLTQAIHRAYEATPPEPTTDDEGGAENDASELVRP